MNLYSNKQKWKIGLIAIALILVGVSLFISNSIVAKVRDRERNRAEQWADAIKNKLELVKLTDRTFTKLRNKELREMSLWIDATKEVSKEAPADQLPDYTFPLKIIRENKDIPVILFDNNRTISGYINLGFDTSDLRIQFTKLNNLEIIELFNDSLRSLAYAWQKTNPSFTVEVYQGLFMTYVYNDSREITRLEKERDSLLTSFNKELINNEGLVPVLLMDMARDSIIGSNLPLAKLGKDKITQTIKELRFQNEPLVIDYQNGQSNILYFDNSEELKQLRYFPYIIFFMIALFVLIGYLIFSTFRKAEQNQVWAGMAKETAHQLGTPLSSLIAWIQFLESRGTDSKITLEMQKDVDRLETITDRFSKIGSGGKLLQTDVCQTIHRVLEYLRSRISDKVEIISNCETSITVPHNPSLMEWVIENIVKNAVDAMEGRGRLEVTVQKVTGWVHIDVSDTGKGIPSKQLKAIFQPGFSTKKRGWGLGLSLVRRIVKEYHHGKVFVLSSEPNKGTTFRISLPTVD
jgi:two-component system, sporulation sensor kinase D